MDGRMDRETCQLKYYFRLLRTFEIISKFSGKKIVLKSISLNKSSSLLNNPCIGGLFLGHLGNIIHRNVVASLVRSFKFFHCIFMAALYNIKLILLLLRD